jgi:hypothetical protein
MRELSRCAFPEPDDVPDDAPAPIEQARTERRRQAEVSHAAALRRACGARGEGGRDGGRGPAVDAAGQDRVRRARGTEASFRLSP